MHFEWIWHRAEFISLEQIQKIIQKQIINTAVVKAIIQHWPEGELYIANHNYKELNHFKKVQNNETRKIENEKA